MEFDQRTAPMARLSPIFTGGLGLGATGGSSSANSYVAEDGSTQYVAEDGSTLYVTEESP